ncbi:MAG: agmatinase [Pseudomonadota bacterium]
MFDDDHEPAPLTAPLVRILPFAYEATVSYGKGTARGPAAIIEAAPQVELFDEELWCEPIRSFRTEIADLAAPPSVPHAALEALAEHVGQALNDGAFPLTLGGEHGLTPGAIRPLVERFGELHIVQIDAHADLRDGYDGEHYSHAAAMRRCLDDERVRLHSFGIRNISAEEVSYLEANQERIAIHWARDRAGWDLDAALAPVKGKPVYITIDVDGFDASLMPATGTPEPGGLFWDDVLAILRQTARSAQVVGADIVELAPHPALHACDFAAAKLCYKLLSYCFAPQSEAKTR